MAKAQPKSVGINKWVIAFIVILVLAGIFGGVVIVINKPPPKYSCGLSGCKTDDNGFFDTLEDCETACQLGGQVSSDFFSRYACKDKKCEKDEMGQYDNFAECKFGCS